MMDFIVELMEPPNYWLLIAVVFGGYGVFNLLMWFFEKPED